ncbi:MAG: GIY-YIG nuclease family protein [Bacteroidales bacterium]
MQIFCYIIYSKTLDRFYIGYTVDFNKRLRQHNSGYYGSGTYTSKVKDWEEYLLISCETIKEAVYIERYIKRMRSRKYIENLKRYPEIIDKIRLRYRGLG